MPKSRPMTYLQAIERVMQVNGGKAPLRHIYENIWSYLDRKRITGKTPENTIQAIVQRDPRFFRVGVGVYALTSEKDKIPAALLPRSETKKIERQHADIQAMLIEIGNREKGVGTYTRDRNSKFLDESGSTKKLGEIISIDKVPPFTYDKGVDVAGRMDVVWFNDRGYPSHLYEVEHTTNFTNALAKFCDLQDFRARFICVAPEEREKRFNTVAGQFAFSAIRGRCEFFTYERVEDAYNTALRGEFI